jgi:translation initiation factor eIF-2B subunit epsilon
MAQVLQLLYDADVIEEDAFFKWAEEKAAADEEDRRFLAKAADFITWLREAEEEDDKDEEEVDEDEE